MMDKTDDEIKKRREVIIGAIRLKYGFDTEVIDSYFEEYPVKITKSVPVWYLGKSIMELSKADAAFFDDGWEETRGCKIEHEVCEKYGIKIIYD